jgi:hypothetical protein
MGDGPISFTAIAEYVKIFRLEDMDDFLYFIRKMDDKLTGLENGKNSSSKSDKNRGEIKEPKGT